MLPYLKQSETIYFTDTLNQKYTQTYTAKPTGKIGLFAEIGKFKINNKRIINYHDFGLSYKWFRGGENFESTTLLNNAPYSASNTTGSYSDHALSLNYNIGHSFDVSDKKFIVKEHHISIFRRIKNKLCGIWRGIRTCQGVVDQRKAMLAPY